MKKFFTRKTTAIICCVAILFTCLLSTGLFTLADSTAKTDDPNAKPEGSVIRVDVGGGVIYKRFTTIMDETDIPDGAYLEYDVFLLDDANIGIVDFGKDNVGWARDHADISFDQGFNILTGETGAGK